MINFLIKLKINENKLEGQIDSKIKIFLANELNIIEQLQRSQFEIERFFEEKNIRYIYKSLDSIDDIINNIKERYNLLGLSDEYRKNLLTNLYSNETGKYTNLLDDSRPLSLRDREDERFVEKGSSDSNLISYEISIMHISYNWSYNFNF